MACTIAITTLSLPAGELGVAYSEHIAINPGPVFPPITYSVTAGSLPDGLTLDVNTAVISGTPTTGNTFNFTIQVIDGNLCTDTQDYSVTISCPAITLGPVSFSPIVNGTPFSEFMSGTGGTGPYIYSVSFGNLPTGLFLDAITGEIYGTPTVDGTFTFAGTVEDAYGCEDTVEYSILITPEEIITTPAYRIGAPTLDDQYNRLQWFMCSIGTKGSELADKLRISTDCCCDINTFELLNMYWFVLECYDPTATGNCLTQPEIDAIWDDISCKTGLCFSPYGSTYTNSSSAGNRIVQGNLRRITSDGSYRAIN